MSVITGIKGVLNLMSGILNGNNLPKAPTDRFTLKLGLKNRKGVNAHSALSSFLTKKSKFVPTGDLPSGEDNLGTKVDRELFEAIFNELLENAVIEVVIDAEEIALSLASLSSKAVTGGAGKTIPAKGKGIIK
jgi:hypothetical protein